MTGAEVTFSEASADLRVEAVPLSHMSIELGHLYMEDFERGPDHLSAHFRRVAPWVAAARRACADAMPPGRVPRVSTCFLIDDYFTRFSSPDVVVSELVEAAGSHGLTIDYLARESACAVADGVPLAGHLLDRLVVDPPPDTTGTRPPLTESGWLSNGQRSPGVGTAPAMAPGNKGWAPPEENSRGRHSVFLDVELWDEPKGGRRWSCPFLAAVWQILRLGLVRDLGRAVAVPRDVEGDLPTDWGRLPSVTRLNADARPFSAYRTVSILAPRFLPVEHAVRMILGQVAVDRDIARQVAGRSAAEHLHLPTELVDRIEYLFVGSLADR